MLAFFVHRFSVQAVSRLRAPAVWLAYRRVLFSGSRAQSALASAVAVCLPQRILSTSNTALKPTGAIKPAPSALRWASENSGSSALE